MSPTADRQEGGLQLAFGQVEGMLGGSFRDREDLRNLAVLETLDLEEKEHGATCRFQPFERPLERQTQRVVRGRRDGGGGGGVESASIIRWLTAAATAATELFNDDSALATKTASDQS